MNKKSSNRVDRPSKDRFKLFKVRKKTKYELTHEKMGRKLGILYFEETRHNNVITHLNASTFYLCFLP